jgi:hypothetical protein
MRILSLLTAGLALSLAGGVAQAGIILNGAHILALNNNGNYTGGIESTTGCCAVASLFASGNLLTPTALGAPNSGLSGFMDLAFSLPVGKTSFVLEGGAGRGTDLFFNMDFSVFVGNAGPSITAFLDASGNLAGGSPGSPGSTPAWSFFAAQVPDAGLFFSSGTQTVTLSNYVAVGGSNSFDLTVVDSALTGAPEPGTVWCMFGAAAGLLALRRRTRQA